MALTSEDLQAISALLKAELKTELEPIKEELKNLDRKIDKVESSLRDEIRRSEYRILDEVERVHDILDTHKADKSKHTA